MKNRRVFLINGVAVSAAIGLLVWLVSLFVFHEPAQQVAGFSPHPAVLTHSNGQSPNTTAAVPAQQGAHVVSGSSSHIACLAQPLAHWLSFAFEYDGATLDAAKTNISANISANTSPLLCIKQHLWQLEGRPNALSQAPEQFSEQPPEQVPVLSPALLQPLTEHQLSQLTILVALVPNEFPNWSLLALLTYAPYPLLEEVYDLLVNGEPALMGLHCQQSPKDCDNTFATVKQNLLAELASHAITHFPDAVVQLLYNNHHWQLNNIVAHSLLTTRHAIALHQLWPALVSAEFGDVKTSVLHHIIELYFTLNRTQTLYYLADYFRFAENHSFPRKFNFPRAIRTLLAWEMDQLHYLTPEHYDADSDLVIQSISLMLAQDPNRVFNRLAQVSSAPLREKVLASIVQSHGFFNLEKEHFITLIRQQPQALAQQLANAYILQFAHLPRSEYQQTVQQLADFVTLTETL